MPLNLNKSRKKKTIMFLNSGVMDFAMDLQVNHRSAYVHNLWISAFFSPITINGEYLQQICALSTTELTCYAMDLKIRTADQFHWEHFWIMWMIFVDCTCMVYPQNMLCWTNLSIETGDFSLFCFKTLFLCLGAVPFQRCKTCDTWSLALPMHL